MLSRRRNHPISRPIMVSHTWCRRRQTLTADRRAAAVTIQRRLRAPHRQTRTSAERQRRRRLVWIVQQTVYVV